METPITVIAPIKLAAGRTEADLLEASAAFQRDFAGLEPGLLRRELVRTGEGTYLDIVQFRSRQDADDIIAREMQSPACKAFFSVMELEAESSEIDYYVSLETWLQ